VTRGIIAVAAFLLALGAWELVRLTSNLPPIILPSVASVFNALISDERLGLHLLTTAREAGTGFLIGNLMAIAAAVLIVSVPKLELAIMPYAVAIKVTPIVAFAPLLIIWFGGGFWGKALAAAAVCFFPTLINGIQGFRSVEPYLLDLFHVWKAKPSDIFTLLRIPTSLPYLFAAFKQSASLAVVGAIVAEFVASNEGLGYLLVIHSRRLNTPELFAAVLACAFLGIVSYYLIELAQWYVARKYHVRSISVI